MTIYEVRIFEVPQLGMGVKFDAAAHRPNELVAITVEARDIEHGRRILRDRFVKMKKAVRSINVGPNAAGRPSYVVYLHGKAIKA